MKNLKKASHTLPIAIWSTIGVITFLLLQINYKYHFFYSEQCQLFVNNGRFISDMLFRIGGLSEFISRWLLQFYAHPYIGALITTIQAMSIAIAMDNIAKKIGCKIPLIILPLLAALFMLFMHFNINYDTAGTIAFILVLICFAITIRIKKTKNRAITASALTILLFITGGAVSTLFALIYFIYEILSNKKNFLFGLIPPILAFLMAILSVYAGWVGEFKFAFLPSAYFQSRLNAPSIVYYPWGLLLATVCLACLLKGRKCTNRTQYILSSIELILFTIITFVIYSSYGDLSSQQYKKLDHYARNAQWDNIIEESKGPLSNLLYVYYLNLALSEKNQLADRYFDFNQKGLQGLIPQWNKDIPSALILSDLNFTIGNITASLHIAFEGNIHISKSGSPRFYQRLIQTNLIYGFYPVAEKYIKLLEQTHNYKDWAAAHRTFLYNDEAVKNDTILGEKRKSLPKNNNLYMSANDINILLEIVAANPTNTAAKEYLSTILLLEKQIPAVIEIADKFYQNEKLPEMIQEAIISALERNPEEWEKYKISSETIKKYESYKQLFLKNRNKPNLSGVMKQNFGNTYWYYLMFS